MRHQLILTKISPQDFQSSLQLFVKHLKSGKTHINHLLTLPVAYLSTYCYEHMSLFEHVVMLIKHSFHFVHASCFSSKLFIPHCYTEITSLYVVYLSFQFGQLIREHLYRTIYKCGHHCAPPTYLF